MRRRNREYTGSDDEKEEEDVFRFGDRVSTAIHTITKLTFLWQNRWDERLAMTPTGIGLFIEKFEGRARQGV